jgi:hypothetical protein
MRRGTPVGRIRRHLLELEDRHNDLIDRPSALQAKILAAFGVNTSTWSKAEVPNVMKERNAALA